MKYIFNEKHEPFTIDGFKYFSLIAEFDELKQIYLNNLFSIGINFGINKGINDGFYKGDIMDLNPFIETSKYLYGELEERSKKEGNMIGDLNETVFNGLITHYKYTTIMINELKTLIK